MIRIVHGDLFASAANALVNPVNCVGVMGAGLAREFRRRFPRMHANYLARCACGEICVGEVSTFRERRRIIVNVPTKRHWRDRSRLADVEAGLAALRRLLLDGAIPSIAVPALGCGRGGLRWEDVEPRTVAALGGLVGVAVEIYPPPDAARRCGHEPIR